jgi:hypothetical protein
MGGAETKKKKKDGEIARHGDGEIKKRIVRR